MVRAVVELGDEELVSIVCSITDNASRASDSR
jgi:hypothetical protein